MPQPYTAPPIDRNGVEPDGVRRVDKWLWCARLAKTRSLGTALALSGRLRLLRPGLERLRIVKPGFRLAIGDILTVPVGRDVRVIEITGFSEVRGPAQNARRLYADLTPGAPEPGLSGSEC